MQNEGREVLAAVAKLNSDIGHIVVALISGVRDDGSLLNAASLVAKSNPQSI